MARDDAEDSGLGLGLGLSQRGIEAIGGSIAVRDLPGKGCVFIIEVPRSSAPTDR
jgi:signal transduction histidine kinase